MFKIKRGGGNFAPLIICFLSGKEIKKEGDYEPGRKDRLPLSKPGAPRIKNTAKLPNKIIPVMLFPPYGFLINVLPLMLPLPTAPE